MGSEDTRGLGEADYLWRLTSTFIGRSLHRKKAEGRREGEPGIVSFCSLGGSVVNFSPEKQRRGRNIDKRANDLDQHVLLFYSDGREDI